MTALPPHTDKDSSATPHMSAVHHHLKRLHAAHGAIHATIAERIAAAARAHEEGRPQPPPENET